MNWIKWDKHTPLQLGRAIGNTTRIVDWYVQTLYNLDKNTEGVEINDHHDNLAARHHCFILLVQRLQVEHKHIINNLKIDKARFRINWK